MLERPLGVSLPGITSSGASEPAGAEGDGEITRVRDTEVPEPEACEPTGEDAPSATVNAAEAVAQRSRRFWPRIAYGVVTIIVAPILTGIVVEIASNGGLPWFGQADPVTIVSPSSTPNETTASPKAPTPTPKTSDAQTETPVSEPTKSTPPVTTAPPETTPEPVTPTPVPPRYKLVIEAADASLMSNCTWFSADVDRHSDAVQGEAGGIQDVAFHACYGASGISGTFQVAGPGTILPTDAELPEAAACARAAQSGNRLEVGSEDLPAGSAICLITDEGQISLLTIRDYPGTTVEFAVTTWKKVS